MGTQRHRSNRSLHVGRSMESNSLIMILSASCLLRKSENLEYAMSCFNADSSTLSTGTYSGLGVTPSGIKRFLNQCRGRSSSSLKCVFQREIQSSQCQLCLNQWNRHSNSVAI